MNENERKEMEKEELNNGEWKITMFIVNKLKSGIDKLFNYLIK